MEHPRSDSEHGGDGYAGGDGMSLKDLLADVNVNEIYEHIETETLSDWVNAWQEAALSALRHVSRERVEKFKEYFDDLYGKGLEVYGWHLNGEPKPFDDFYEDACKYAGL